MTQQFRQIVEGVYASPQIGLADVELAKAMGVSLIINNRPELESPDQTPGAEIEAAARAAGIAYVAIPVTHAGFSDTQVTAMVQALDEATGPVSPIAAPAPAPPCCGRWPKPARAPRPTTSPQPPPRPATTSARSAP